MLEAPCPSRGLLHIHPVAVPCVRIRDSAPLGAFVSPVCQVSLKELFSRISLFPFHDINSLGHIMKQQFTTSNNIGDDPFQMSFIHSADNY